MKEDDIFSLNDFRKWIASKKDERAEKKSPLIGRCVESKISAKRVAVRMTNEEGSSRKLAKEFKEFGGTIIGVEGDELLIEVDSGTFRIPKFLVRIAKPSS